MAGGLVGVEGTAVSGVTDKAVAEGVGDSDGETAVDSGTIVGSQAVGVNSAAGMTAVGCASIAGWQAAKPSKNNGQTTQNHHLGRCGQREGVMAPQSGRFNF
jgi:hypothetical protein